MKCKLLQSCGIVSSSNAQIYILVNNLAFVFDFYKNVLLRTWDLKPL